MRIVRLQEQPSTSSIATEILNLSIVLSTKSRLSLAGFVLCLVLPVSAVASPWAEVGDGQLRSDIEILAAAGVIDDITMQWPLPWAGVAQRLSSQSLADQPEYVRAAADRIKWMANNQTHIGQFRAAATIDATNSAAVVRGFDALGREDVQGAISVEYVGSTTAVRLSVGAQTINHAGGTTLAFDNSYIAQKVGGAIIYAGFLPHWWGPGWISSLSLSNNAQPMPQIGIARNSTEPFKTPLLSWLGPWQFEFFVGVLNGPRIARNTGYVGTRVAINPIPHLEIGFSRTTELCGTGHPCVPFRDYLKSGAQTSASPNETNDEASFDFKYSSLFEGLPYQIYMQIMNEDNGPFVQSASSHLFGASAWISVGTENPLRLTFEYTDSNATANFFSFGKIVHGVAYNNSSYVDGMRYRDRSLGFSLDGDSRLTTVQGSWLDHNGWSYRLSYYRARVSDPLNNNTNVVTTAPVTINIGEVRWGVPFKNMRFELAGRLQDDQPRPDRGFQAAAELVVTYSFR